MLYKYGIYYIYEFRDYYTSYTKFKKVIEYTKIHSVEVCS